MTSVMHPLTVSGVDRGLGTLACGTVGAPQPFTIKPITKQSAPHQAAMASWVSRHAKGALLAELECSKHPPAFASVPPTAVVGGAPFHGHCHNRHTVAA
jgi:hypothetical protein